MKFYKMTFGLFLLWNCLFASLVFAQVAEKELEYIGKTEDDFHFWVEVVNAPGYVAGGVWLDAAHTSLVTILYDSPPGEGINLDELTNASFAVIDKKGEEYIVRQKFDLWDSQRDYNTPERLSLPMHGSLLTHQQDKEFPISYYRVGISTVDIDADGDDDILIELLRGGGSYNGYQFFALQNTDNTYTTVLNKMGGYGDTFKRVQDLDADEIPEILIWDEIYTEGVPHFYCQTWVDIYEWDGTKMKLSNREFPAFYTQLKAGFLIICEANRQRPLEILEKGNSEYIAWITDIAAGCLNEQTYYLGLIAEYEGNYRRAELYYKSLLRIVSEITCKKFPS